MKLNKILKIVAILSLIIMIIATLIILYFFNIDIETKMPKETSSNTEIESYNFMSRKVYTIIPKEKSENNKYILYLHGGSYVAEATQNHWDFLEKIAEDTGYMIIMPDYPLTPKYNYKDVYNMLEPLYKEIISKIGNDKLILMGDSAGGGIALGLYEKMANQFIEKPINTILISPWLDVKLENPNIEPIEQKDNILNKELLRLAGISYAGEDGMDSYLVNPINGDLSKLENIKIFIGTDDILNADCKLLKEKADKVNGDVEIKEYQEAKHIWIIDKNSNAEITEKAYNDLVEELR